MTDQLISFETAKLAKEKGYNIACYHWYNNHPSDNKQLRTGSLHNHNHPKDSVTMSAPTQSLLQKWLREVHNIHINIIYNDEFGCYISGIISHYPFNTYEEALEYDLIEALKLIKI